MSERSINGETKCDCLKETHNTDLIVITGGPGAGKTAILEMAKKVMCKHVAILPESASIVFGGGFWRLESSSARNAAQRAIYHVQREMENLVLGEKCWAAGLCDRGTLDGLAYWSGSERNFFELVQHRVQEEFARYRAVIHLHSPSAALGYNHSNPLRVESAREAQAIDEKIRAIWSGHPNYKVIESSASFLTKAKSAITHIVEALPECCQSAVQLRVRNGS